MDKITDLDDGLGEPAQFLVENIDLLPRGRALDIAMGSGRNAIYLAKMGFQVEGVDVSREAVEETLARARDEGVSIQIQVEDLEKIPYLDEEVYELVICFNYLQRSLMPQMKNWVKPGGMLVYETFIIDQSSSVDLVIRITFSSIMSCCIPFEISACFATSKGLSKAGRLLPV